MTEPLTEGQVEDLLKAAGFAIAKLEVRAAVRTYGSGEELIRFFEASSFGNLLSHIPEQHRGAAREVLRRELDDIARAGELMDERIGLIAIGIR